MNEKAVVVAKDVLKHLNAMAIKDGHYFQLVTDETEILYREGDLQEHVEEVQAHCTVCLLGACVLSKARIYDTVSMETFREMEICCSDSDVRETLADIFDIDTINCMEAAFEVDRFNWMRATDHKLIEAAMNFGSQFQTRKECVRAVMENIIANNGKFIVNAEVTV